jgi:hypothetical protein
VRSLRFYAIAVICAAALSGLLCEVYAMPEFTLLAVPGVFFGLAAAGNTPDSNAVLIFFGNWFFYSIVFAISSEIVLLCLKARRR